MNKINFKINDKDYSVDSTCTILEAANKNNIEIPTLCFLKEINEIGSCRICLVEVSGYKDLVTACNTQINDGMVIYTESNKVIESRKKTLELLLSVHNKDCENCIRNNNCEFQTLLNKYKIIDTPYKGNKKNYELDKSTEYLVRDNNKCIMCRRCSAVCKNIQGVAVIGPNDRGINTHIGCAFDKNLSDVPCILCGQCVVNCPTGALTEKDDTNIVIDALNNKNIHVIVGVAPSIRVSLGEEFGYDIGTNVKGKIVSSLKKLGFNKVFDVNFGADLTIIEEATEFIERLYKNEKLPMFTSCSPGWIKYIEQYYPNLINNLSTCKSPQQMFGSIIKTYYAKNNKIDPKNIFVVTVMPCIAKKYECKRDNQNASSYPDIDAVITTRELARLIKRFGINFNDLENSDFDNPFGLGASVIFGASGGVMESALRTVVETITKKPLEKLEFNEVRGMEGIKEATYILDGKTINIAIASGIENAKKIIEKINNGEANYHFVEIMTCPGGCINGGGQPIHPAKIKNSVDIKELRAKTLYEEDKNLPVRNSYKNPYIRDLYNTYLEKPGSKLAHEILHTIYKKKNKYN